MPSNCVLKCRWLSGDNVSTVFTVTDAYKKIRRAQFQL